MDSEKAAKKKEKMIRLISEKGLDNAIFTAVTDDLENVTHGLATLYNDLVVAYDSGLADKNQLSALSNTLNTLYDIFHDENNNHLLDMLRIRELFETLED